jgi:hypothetical protein
VVDNPPEHWDVELKVLKNKTAKMIATGKLRPNGIVGVGVDDVEKRDYFIPRLQAMLDDTRWTIIFRIITIEDGLKTFDVKAKR